MTCSCVFSRAEEFKLIFNHKKFPFVCKIMRVLTINTFTYFHAFSYTVYIQATFKNSAVFVVHLCTTSWRLVHSLLRLWREISSQLHALAAFSHIISVIRPRKRWVWYVVCKGNIRNKYKMLLNVVLEWWTVSGDQLCRLSFFVVFLSPSRRIPA
jgi:hypothetical protein